MKLQALFIAQPTYTAFDGKKAWDDLPHAAEEAKRLADELGSHGYELGRRDLLEGGDKRVVEGALHDWYRRATESSCLMLFWTGHGYTEAGRFFLICRDSPAPGNISPLNAIDSTVIGALIGNCRATKILVVLDTSHSGLGAQNISETLVRYFAERIPQVGQPSAFAIIASAHQLEQAKEGILSSALRTALLEPNISPDKRRWTNHDEFINTADLCQAVRRLMPDDVSPLYVAAGFDQSFIPNPRYHAGLPAENINE